MGIQRRNRSLENTSVRQRIGPAIKALRRQQSLSLDLLAEASGISPSHLSRIERGLTVPSYDVLDRIADALGSDLRTLREEEEQAKIVDSEFQQICRQLGISAETQFELLNLSSRTRSELVTVLRHTVQSA